MDNKLDTLTQEVLKFRDERNWAKYHTGKNLAICLSVEANELLELFLWKENEEINQDKLKDEIGDVFYSLLLLANKYSIDLETVLIDKIQKNKLKYPVDKYFNSNKKYNE